MYLDYLNRPEDYYCIDIETDSLDAKVIWMMSWENIKTREKGRCIGHEEITRWFLEAPTAIFVGHNALRFDIRIVNQLLGLRIPTRRLADTLILSMLYSPNLDGGHSLAAWAERIGMKKGDHNDFTHLSDEMIKYCDQDVNITAELFRKITKVLNKLGFSEKTCHIQHHFMSLLDRQTRNGFYFNIDGARSLYNLLQEKQAEIQESIDHVFPPVRNLVRTGRVHLKNGNCSAQYERDFSKYEIEYDDSLEWYSAYEAVPFNIGSPKQRVEKLLGLGWQPDTFTPKGHPKPTEEGLIAFADATGIPEVALITKYLSYNGRANMINTWMESYNNETHAIHGKLFLADTLRLRHQSPNTANIPGVRQNKQGRLLLGDEGFYTYESRDLWTARPGRCLVGTDASGLELRMLAHYINREAFTRIVLDGDPHQYNADLAGVDRPTAKTLLYAIQYGAQAKKVASIIKGTVEEGAELRQRFLDRLGLTGVMNDAISEQKNGRVSLIDGARVVCPSPHSALNYKLQGGGARVMAQGAIFLEEYIRRHGLDSLKVGDIHDEWEYDVDSKDAEEHRKLSVQAIQDAGEELNLNISLTGKAKIGLTWAETH